MVWCGDPWPKSAERHRCLGLCPRHAHPAKHIAREPAGHHVSCYTIAVNPC